MRDRRRSERHGRFGDAQAAWWLRLTGRRVLAMRLCTPVGEIDLIAWRGHTELFVEVETRATAAELDRAIDRYRLERVAVAVNMVAHCYTAPGDNIQIDGSVLAPRCLPRPIVNAWQG